MDGSEGCGGSEADVAAWCVSVAGSDVFAETEDGSGVPSRVAGGENPRPSFFEDHGHSEMFALPMVARDEGEGRIGLEGVLEKRRLLEFEHCESCLSSVKALCVKIWELLPFECPAIAVVLGEHISSQARPDRCLYWEALVCFDLKEINRWSRNCSIIIWGRKYTLPLVTNRYLRYLYI